jgi:hypothetical protein
MIWKDETMRTSVMIMLAGLAGLAQSALADEERANRPHVVADVHGQCYAKSVPDKSSGQEGSTGILAVEEAGDRLVHTLPWYSSQIHIQCQVVPGYAAISVVRMGPWAQGYQARAQDLALAFYHDGRLVRQYSTLEIAGRADNVSRSSSHYTVIRRQGWSQQPAGSLPSFEVETEDKRRLTFDPATGNILATAVYGPAPEQQAHIDWVGKVYERMLTIKPGMTRGQLLQVFQGDGGLSTPLQGRFVSRECLYFKVDVEFAAVGRPSRDGNGRVTMVESDEDRITRISKPYLEPAFAD